MKGNPNTIREIELKVVPIDVCDVIYVENHSPWVYFHAQSVPMCVFFFGLANGFIS